MINNGEKLVFIAHPLRGNGTKEEFDYNIEMYKNKFMKIVRLDFPCCLLMAFLSLSQDFNKKIMI